MSIQYDAQDVSTGYVRMRDGGALAINTLFITVPDPDYVIVVSMDGEELRFTMGEALHALAKLLKEDA